MPKVKLKDVVARIRDKVDKDSTELEYYIGGEHIDSGEISITRKGIIEGSTIGPAFHMHFKPGDVLLMSRNPHLKKAGVVDFEGICSDVSYICRTKDEKILMQRYLPFVFQTDHFWAFVEENKKGGLPFFLNWSDFERYEFFLPSYEKQQELADLLWAAQNTKLAYLELLRQTDDLVKSQFIEMFGDPITNPKGLPVFKLSELADLITKGASPNWQGYGYTEDKTQTLFVTSENVREGVLDLSEPKYLEDGFNEKQKRSMLKKGDFLINIVGASIGRAARFDLDVKANINQAVALVRMGQEKVLSNYMMYYLNSPKALEMYNSMKSAVARANLSLQNIGDLEILVPPIDQQEQFAEFINQSDKSKFDCSNRNLSRCSVYQI